MPETITIQGNIGNDPQQTATPAGVPITKFRVGCTHRVLDKSTNEWVDKYTNWYNISAFGKLAEHAFASLKRGDAVIVGGRLIQNSWESNGTTHTSVDITADTIGHDLRWGTAIWERRTKAKRQVPARENEVAETTDQAADTAAPDSGNTDDDGWAVPSPELAGATAAG